MFDALQAWCDIGEALKRQREVLGPHQYLGWAKQEFGWDKTTVSEFIGIYEYWSPKVGISQLFDPSKFTRSVALELSRKNVPQEVRDRVESLLVDGQKVTVADIRKMKAEAKSASDRAEALAERNAELASKTPEPALIETIVDRSGESAARIRELEDRVRSLSEANTQRAAENAALRERLAAKAPPQAATPSADAPNVIRPNFGPSEHEGDPDRFETGDITDEDAIDAFSGSLGAMENLKIDPKEFWKRQGKKTAHGKRVHQALLNVNAIIGLLIKEHAK